MKFEMDSDSFLGGYTRFDFDKIYYLSGPMAGYPEHNFPAFQKAMEELEESGVLIRSPHKMKPPMANPTDQDYLAHDFAQMCMRCDGIILLQGWPQSVGARAELEIAMTLKWPVYYYEDWTLYDMNRRDS